MTEFFISMEQEFNKNINSINRKIFSLSKSSENGDTLLAESKNELNASEFCIKQMELEAIPLPDSMKKELQTKVRKYKQDYEEVRIKLAKCESNYIDEARKNNLFNGHNYDSENAYQRSKIEEQNLKLEEAKRNGYETLGIAMDINTNLKDHTDLMGKNIKRIREMNDELSWSNYIINVMNQRIKKNKLICYSVVFVVSSALLIILYSYIA